MGTAVTARPLCLIPLALLVACSSSSSEPGASDAAVDTSEPPADAGPEAEAGPGDASPDAIVDVFSPVPDAFDFDATTPSPTFVSECENGDSWIQRADQPGGSVVLGASDDGASDDAACRLTFAGDALLGAEDNVGPAHATEIQTTSPFHFGRYFARVRLAACDSSEEVVNGIFTYANDGTDHNQNGLVDNAEIDIEILCGEPTYILLTSWTDYDEGLGEFRKWSRAIDTSTGDIYESPANDVYGLDLIGTDPGLALAGFPDPDAYYELGFEWHASSIRFFMWKGLEEVTLWLFEDASLIPQLESPFLLNVWHPNTHWFAGGPADYPAKDAVMHVDWFVYWSEADWH